MVTSSVTPGSELTLLLLTGGKDGYFSYLSSTEVYPPTPSCSPPPLPSPRGHHVIFLTAAANPMVATCGGNDNEWLSSCLVLNATANRWEENVMGSLLRAKGNHAVATLEGVGVYVIGGEGTSTGTTEFLPTGSLKWEEGPALPVDMYRPCAVTISPTSFLAIYGSEIREFDASIAGPLSRRGWRKRSKWPRLKTRRIYWPGCAKVGGKVIIAGGYSRGTNYDTTEILDLTTRTISDGGNMASPRRVFHINTVIYRNSTRTFALGGSDGRNELKLVEEWNPESETWTRVRGLKAKRDTFGMVAAPKKLICSN